MIDTITAALIFTFGFVLGVIGGYYLKNNDSLIRKYPPQLKYCKVGDYYFKVEETQCGYLITEEKVTQLPANAELIEIVS